MKRLTSITFALVLFALGTAVLHAQVPPPPTPTPDPHTYSDPAMNYVAPPDAYLIMRRTVALADLTEDLQPVAGWVLRPGQEDARVIQLAMESYTGPPDQWEAQFSSQMHGSQDGVLIRNAAPIALTNGMPAQFVEVTFGSGFTAKKEFAVVWADGQRGIVLAEIGRVGDVSDTEAKRVLHDVNAVRYPVNQP